MRDKSKTMITAHSGSDGTPDNSIVFIKEALINGTDAFEIDVNLGAHDKLLYLRHDRDTTETYSGCPTLSQAFELMKPYDDVKINCDLKSHGLEVMVMEAAAREGLSDRLIFSGSVGLDFLKRNPSIHESVDIFLNIEEIFGMPMEKLRDKISASPQDFSATAQQAADVCNSLGVHVINVPYKICNEVFLDIMTRKDIGISAWTVNDREDIERLLNKEIVNITTRRACLAVSIRSALDKKKKSDHGGVDGD